MKFKSIVLLLMATHNILPLTIINDTGEPIIVATEMPGDKLDEGKIVTNKIIGPGCREEDDNFLQIYETRPYIFLFDQTTLRYISQKIGKSIGNAKNQSLEIYIKRQPGNQSIYLEYSGFPATPRHEEFSLDWPDTE